MLLLNPALWPWLFAAAVPVVIHLLTRKSRQRMPLPTVKFLQKVIANQSKVWRWKNFLVLLLRSLAMVTLAAAFVRPTLPTPYSVTKGQKIGAVVILDVSASMSFGSGGFTGLDEAKAQARKVIEGLGEDGDRCGVVLCGAKPTLGVEAPTTDMSLALNAVRSARQTEERANATAALNLAVDQLEKAGTGVRRLYVISDFQRTNWSDVRTDSVPGDVQLFFLSVDHGGRDNAGIVSLSTRPTSPKAGTPFTFQAEVFNSSPKPRTLTVTLAAGQSRPLTSTVSVAPYSSTNASFPFTSDRAERIEATASLAGDDLRADDARRAVVDLGQSSQILLLTDEDTDAPTSAAFYVSRALQPDAESRTGVRLVVVRPSQLSFPVLKLADAVIVCNAPSMPSAQPEALSRYVTEGGNLVWLLYGDRMTVQLASFGKSLPKSEPLPLVPQSEVNVAGKAKGYVRLAEIRTDSRILKAFRDPASAGLDRAKFTRFWITSEVDPRAETLLKYEDGTAAAVRAGEGQGSLLLLNMSPAPSWSDLARQDVFVPLLHEFLKGVMAKETGARESHPGEAASATVASGTGAIVCLGPDGTKLPVTQDKSTGAVVVDDARDSGFYRLSSDGRSVASVAVNVHSDETDLRTVDPRELESQAQRQRTVFDSAGTLATVEPRKGREIWMHLLLVGLAFLFGEQVVRRIGTKAVRPARAGRT